LLPQLPALTSHRRSRRSTYHRSESQRRPSPTGTPQAQTQPQANPPTSPPVTPAKDATANPRDPVSVARKTPAIASRIAKLRQAEGGSPSDQAQQLDERVTSIELGGQCGFAGCSSTTLVVFTYRTRGANTATSSVMALVSCPPIMRQGCTAVPAEVQPQGQLEQTR
jgi:hypothetical protein